MNKRKEQLKPLFELLIYIAGTKQLAGKTRANYQPEYGTRERP